MAGTKAKSGKKGRKIGRNKAFCERYRAEGRRLKNKIAKLRSHLRHFPEDAQAQQVLGKL